MKRQILSAAAFAAVAACGGSDTGSEPAGAEDEVAAVAEAPAMLPNGIPAYGDFDPATGIEREESEGARHEVAYLSPGSIADIFEFYRRHYRDAGHEIPEGGVDFGSDDPAFGGYVQLFDQGERLMVHVSPKAGSGGYDLSENLGDGFPAYPGLSEDEYDVRPRSNGSRLVIFRISNGPDAALEVLDFYREAGREAGYEERGLSLAARSEAERIEINITDTNDGAERRVMARSTDRSGGR
ncbi:MAG: hypothetical protein ABR601_07570 [Parasphingopyxis sp.]|nr:hypothetical protein [Sphingomonadales bacterium]